MAACPAISQFRLVGWLVGVWVGTLRRLGLAVVPAVVDPVGVARAAALAAVRVLDGAAPGSAAAGSGRGLAGRVADPPGAEAVPLADWPSETGNLGR
jgi:hypothetical protein